MTFVAATDAAMRDAVAAASDPVDASRRAMEPLIGLRPADARDRTTHVALFSVDRARFWVPMGTRSAAAASCLAYNSLRPRSVARQRSLLGRALRSRWGPHLGSAMTSASGPALALAESAADPGSLAEAVDAFLGRGPLQFGTSPRPVDPWWTPTLQLFDLDGEPVAYAKVGWTPITRAQVRTEAHVMRAHGGGDGRVRIPAGLGILEHDGLVISFAAPMPPDVTRVPDDSAPPEELLDAVAGLDEAPRRANFEESGTVVELVQLLEAAVATGDSVSEVAAARSAVGRALDAALARTAHLPVPLGRWHGDWVPWNMARRGDATWLWDWEYSGADRPVGLDLLHWHYQQDRVVSGMPVGAALEASGERSHEVLKSRGVAADDEYVLMVAHPIELLRRSLAAMQVTAPGWERLASEFSECVDVLGRRLDERR